MARLGVVELFFDPEAFAAEYKGEGDKRKLTDEELKRLGQLINDEIGSFYYGYSAWNTKFVDDKAQVPTYEELLAVVQELAAVNTEPQYETLSDKATNLLANWTPASSSHKTGDVF